jgi:hypothetical protein
MNCWEFKNGFGAYVGIEKSPTAWGDEMGVKGTLPCTRIIYQMSWVTCGQGKSPR